MTDRTKPRPRKIVIDVVPLILATVSKDGLRRLGLLK